VASIALPRIMRVGGGASQEIGAVLQGLGLQRPLIVTDEFLLSHGQVDRLWAAWSALIGDRPSHSRAFPSPECRKVIFREKRRLSPRARPRGAEKIGSNGAQGGLCVRICNSPFKGIAVRPL
jgi:hypothetical protein